LGCLSGWSQAWAWGIVHDVGEQPLQDGQTGFARVPDGRRLAFCEWGDPKGAAVLYLHGVPGSRYLRHMGSVYADARLRVITYERPGYGLSDRAPGRIVVDTAADAAVIADCIGLTRFSVVGVSAGAAHALAVAALLPARVDRCVGIKPLAPYQAEGLDFFAGMDPNDAAVLRAAAQGDHAAIAAEAAGASEWVASDFPGLSAPEPVASMLKQTFREAFRQGLDGHIDDMAAHVRNHGYDLQSVSVPTLLLAARGDEQVPPGHARWLADHLPRAQLAWMEGGHMEYHEQEEMSAFIWAGHGSP
jgi:pimeloyl-ACP methyl ester carboxylesterase